MDFTDDGTFGEWCQSVIERLRLEYERMGALHEQRVWEQMATLVAEGNCDPAVVARTAIDTIQKIRRLRP